LILQSEAGLLNITRAVVHSLGAGHAAWATPRNATHTRSADESTGDASNRQDRARVVGETLRNLDKALSPFRLKHPSGTRASYSRFAEQRPTLQGTRILLQHRFGAQFLLINWWENAIAGADHKRIEDVVGDSETRAECHRGQSSHLRVTPAQPFPDAAVTIVPPFDGGPD